MPRRGRRAVRAGRVRENAERDRQRMNEVNELAAEYASAVAALRPERLHDQDVAEIGRLLEEYRVATFAQPMRTSVPVSAKRVRAAVAALQR